MTPFHAGERAVQERMGQADIAGRVGRMIRGDIPAVAASFLAEQSMVVLAAADAAGRMWASQLSGPPGFLRADGAHAVLIDARPAVGDPLREALDRSAGIGLIALQPQRRRRMRVNGTATPEGDGLRIITDQVYSNCPKYISRRQIRSYDPRAAARPRHASALDAQQRSAIAAADTFFLASADTEGNADASHRGGNPGFLEMLSPTRLRWPDYRGNSMFMTLGNIAVNPRCGILVPNWSTGGCLQLTGTAELVWAPRAEAADGQCSIEFTVTEVVDTSAAGPLRWGPAELSPVNP
ncbi:pyridoxamine 5'-phosphate oxidase family protein [Nocardia cyriacigeorgica]|uniref:Pyridoxamine 5'-phosphate oxidase family protein n=1 Tax=Nocardia cyriacigeorgica TaxID=135487 RepID=A0ABX0CDH2_9NOCA|nr:pyridoxamine 5'-phosphate oxidase family protein [Nocardia cyriacigeorgica]NEW39370.1 pyridoxamine 5'-phosphate oxidase family protein [Nocardia cyriacigeorgica]NEW49875.1 pyridoxamine 5'-phosphate oxidase family protein [Nocardia cyriacigeorgica]NEW54610.1 pyridoxamine 5'-phosphate oxidase family protein [Nocardia cyriacigeorgica]